MKRNIRLSRQLAERIGAKPQECYSNSWKVVEEIMSAATYVEGIAYQTGVFDHAWVEFEDQIIDVTKPEKGIIYIPALRFSGSDGLALAKRISLAATGDWAQRSLIEWEQMDFQLPIFWAFGRGGKASEPPGWQSVEMCKARLEAENRFFNCGDEAIRKKAISEREQQLHRAIDFQATRKPSKQEYFA